jgi:uncharacterized protein YdaU (DUF1376 family)
MNYYERHLGDYARDTAHLSLIEDGAYNRLLDRYYATEKPLPLDLRELSRLVRAHTAAERAAIKQVLAEFFVETPDGWRHGRCDEEIAKAHVRIETARSNGNRGGRPKKKPGGLSADGTGGTEQKPGGLFVGSEIETQQKALQSPDSNLQTPDPVDTSHPGVCVSANSARAMGDTHAQEVGHPGPCTAARSWEVSEHEHHRRFVALQAIYPPYPGHADWLTAEHHCRRLLERGEAASWDDLKASVRRYAEYVAGGGVSHSRYVMSPVKFFGDISRPWASSWAVPTALAAAGSVVPMRARKTAAEYEAECPGSTR